MGAAAAVIVIRERRMVEAFQLAGATSPQRSRTADELGVDPTSVGWRRLRERAVIREESPGSDRFYLDFEVWKAVRRMRMRLLVVLLIIVLGVWLSFVVAGLTRHQSP